MTFRQTHKSLSLFFAIALVGTLIVGCAAEGTVPTTGSIDGQPAVRPTGERVEIINVSYDPTRELYEEYGKTFSQYYLAKTGVAVDIKNSHGGSGSQARAVIDGLQADVVTLALAWDTEAVARRGLINSGWESELPNNSNPYVSTIVFLVRKGNPKGIKSWDDLSRQGVEVITPNPKTSGGARWNFLAAWAWSLQNGKTEEQAREQLSKLFSNVPVLDTGARGSTETFVVKGIGDVLVAWENEAILSTKEVPDQFEIIYPAFSILAEPAVAIVDANVEKKKTRAVAEEFLKYLYSDTAQELIAKNGYRPTNPTILDKYRSTLPPIAKLTNIRELGGWEQVQKKFFDDGGVFDQIYKAR